jgi:hypothetical protein
LARAASTASWKCASSASLARMLRPKGVKGKSSLQQTIHRGYGKISRTVCSLCTSRLAGTGDSKYLNCSSPQKSAGKEAKSTCPYLPTTAYQAELASNMLQESKSFNSITGRSTVKASTTNPT